MKKLIGVAMLGLALVGCAGGRVIYSPSLFGDPVGCIIAVEDKETGAMIYKLVSGTGNSQMWVLLKKDSQYVGGR